jgi:glucose-fructose oxidoreductase
MPRTRTSNPRRRTSAGSRKVRYAVLGQGYIAQAAVLPAFGHAARNSELAALVSDDPAKLKTLGRRYGVSARYTYDRLEECLKDVDAVYVALPNSLHREYTERAAAAGVHVLCEKPMAVTEEDCRAMIRACRDANVKLMVAYRLHFEAANLAAVEAVRSGRIGEARVFASTFTMNVKDRDNIRLRKDLGGGTLYDIGIYCINAARYLFRQEPLEAQCVTATNGEARFSEVEEMASAVLRFPGDRLAAFTCSFGAGDVSVYQVVGTKGNVRLDPAYEYAGELKMTLTVDGRKQERTYTKRDQFAPELLHFSDCILSGRDPQPGGEEGFADVRVIRALYQSAARGGRPVRLAAHEPPPRPSRANQERRPPVRKPQLVGVSSPSGD